MSNKTIHLCDFDGTLTHRDSLWAFLLFTQPLPRLLGGLCWVGMSFLGMVLAGKWNNSRGKERLLAQFFAGKTKSELAKMGESFVLQKIPSLLRNDLFERLQTAQRNDEKVVVVSASPDVWLSPFCTAAGFDLICTELDYNQTLTGHSEPVFSGYFATPNCQGFEKKVRIQAAYSLDLFDKIVAYGNSKGDFAMYELATEVHQFGT